MPQPPEGLAVEGEWERDMKARPKRIATFVATGRFGLAFRTAAAEVERKTKYHKYL